MAWTSFTRITLRQAVSGSPEAVEWVGSFDPATNDASIQIATFGAKQPMAGTVALVGGRIMLTKELKLGPGYEIDALNTPPSLA